MRLFLERNQNREVGELRIESSIKNETPSYSSAVYEQVSFSEFPGAKMYKLLLTFTCCVLFAIPVFADTVNVPFSTSSAGPFSFQADSFSLSGESGLLALDTASFIVGDIATAALIFGDSGSFSGSGNFLLSYN